MRPRSRSATARRHRSALALAAIGALVLAACGADEPEAPEEPVAEEPAAPEEDDAEQPEEDDTDDAGAVPTEPGGELSLDEVLELLSQVESRPLQVEYDLRDPAEFGDGRMVIVQDPPRSVLLVEAPEGSLQLINDGERTYSCFAEGADWQCFVDDTPMEDMADDLLVVPGVDDLDIEDGEHPDRIERSEVLGRAVVCLYFDEQDDLLDVEACIDEETGAVLLMRGTYVTGGDFALEATSFGDPDEALFEPPAEPMELQF